MLKPLLVAAIAFSCPVSAKAEELPKAHTDNSFVSAQALRSQFGSIAEIRSILEEQIPSFNDRQASRMAAHLSRLLAHDSVLRLVAQDSGLDVDGLPPRDRWSVYVVVASNVKEPGLQRLDDADIALWIQFLDSTLQVAEPSACAAFLSGELEVDGKALLDYQWKALAGVGPLTFERLLVLFGKSWLAEATRVPAVRPVDEEQARAADEAFVAAGVGRLERAHVEGRSTFDPFDADPKTQCEMARASVRAYDDLPLPLRSWALLAFAKGLRKGQ